MSFPIGSWDDPESSSGAASVIAILKRLRTLAGNGTITSVSVSPTITAGAYHANDNIGGKMTLSGALRSDTSAGIWHSLHIIDAANQKAAMVIQIFNADPAVATLNDNAAIVHSTDIGKVIRTIAVAASDYQTVGGKAFADINIGQTVQAASGSTLYAAAMVTGTPTYAATTDLTFRFGFIQA